MHKSGCGAKKLACLLLVIGGLNWGLVGLGGFFGGNWNVVNILLGSIPALENIVYILVGLSAVVKFVGCPCKKCKSEGKGCCGSGKCK